jgi:heme/copper-type cytochrome/quinol oxidase subunit 4
MKQHNLDSQISHIVSILFITIGIIICLGSSYWLIQTYNFTQTAQKVIGQVESLNAGGSHPQISFQLPDGSTKTYPQNGLIFGYTSNQKVEVLYDPNDLNSVSVNNFGALWGFPILGFILSFIFGAVGFGKLFGRK